VLTVSGGVPVWSTPASGGTVTSVAASGGSTGLSFTGSPITTSGTLTLTGTLAIANGGTGFTTYTAGDLLYASGTTTLAKLGVGTNGYVLTLAAGLPTWAAATGGVTTFIGRSGAVAAVEGDYSLTLLSDVTAVTGTGSVVAMQTSPQFTTPSLGVASAASLAIGSGGFPSASPLLLTNGQLVTIALTSQTVGATTLTIPDFASVADEFTFKTKAQTLANKTLTAPTIGASDFTNANHAHTGASSGGSLSASAIGSGQLTVDRGGTAHSTVSAAFNELAQLNATPSTTYGRSFLYLADATAARTLMGLGTMSTASTTSYVSIASPETITGNKIIQYSGAGTGLIVRQGGAQAQGDKILTFQNVGTGELGYVTPNWNETSRAAITCRDDVVVGLPATAGYGALRMWGWGGGLFTLRPQATGSRRTDVIIPSFATDADVYMVTSTNGISAIGTIPVLGSGPEPATAGFGSIAVINKTGQAQNYATLRLLTNGAPAGFYVIYAYLECTTIGTVGNPAFQVGYTDDVGLRSPITVLNLASMTSLQRASGQMIVYLASGDISWKLTGWVDGQFTLRVRVMYLGA
jgi:hypothetical protein